MKLVVITTINSLEQIPMMLASCKKYDIDIKPYGLGRGYSIWADMKILWKIPVLEEHAKSYTHVLYTDSRDAFFTDGLDNILLKYKLKGQPACLVSAERACNPDTQYTDNYPDPGTPYRFPCVGGYIGEIPYMLETFRHMATYRDRSGDDAAIWQWAYDAGWFRPQIDTGCSIFQTMSGNASSDLEVANEIYLGSTEEELSLMSLRNKLTRSYPCLLHFNGGYSDAVTGKFDMMLPWWKKIHPEIDLEAK